VKFCGVLREGFGNLLKMNICSKLQNVVNLVLAVDTQTTAAINLQQTWLLLIPILVQIFVGKW
jgi:hypothetical protein